jgi:hypothetical protein
VCEANIHSLAFRYGLQSGFIAHHNIACDYVPGPRDCDSRNAIEAWQRDGVTLTDNIITVSNLTWQ